MATGSCSSSSSSSLGMVSPYIRITGEPETSSVTKVASKNFDPRPVLFRENLASYIFSFLESEELRKFTKVSKCWRQFYIENSNSFWLLQCRTLVPGFLNEIVPAGVSYQQAFNLLYPLVFGREFYLTHFDIDDIGPVPPASRRQLLEADGLTSVSEYFIKKIDKKSPLGLDKNGMLTEDPLKHAKAPSEFSRPEAINGKVSLKIPVTVNNMGILTEKHLKKGTPTGFSEYSWKAIFEQHGNTRGQSAYLSAQKKNVIGGGLPYSEQKKLAKDAGLEVVDLISRIFFNLLSRVRCGECPDSDYIARTSTVTVGNVPWQSGVWWSTSDPSARLLLYGRYYADDDYIGVAVGVPAGSSEAIGH